MAEFDKSTYDQQYAREKLARKMVPFNREHDADALAWLEHIDEPFAAYVKRLIREDMKRNHFKMSE